MKKLSIKDRLSKKTVKELKDIYVRLTGKDLLRGRKEEMVITLCNFLEARNNWNIIAGR